MKQHILAITVLLLTLIVPTSAQNKIGGYLDCKPSQTLEGIKEIGLIIEYGQVDGLAEEMRPAVLLMLQDRARSRLTQAAIPLLQLSDEADMVGRPRLVFTVNLKKESDNPPSLDVRSKFYQTVQLQRDPAKKVELATWRTGNVGPKPNKEMLFAFFDNQLDAFIKDYRAMNPPSPIQNPVTDSVAQPKHTANALQGLDRVNVNVLVGFVEFAGRKGPTFSNEHYQALLTTLQSDAENKLIQAGIQLTRNDADSEKSGWPLLNFKIYLAPPNSYSPEIEIRSEFWQRVRPVIGFWKLGYAISWESRASDVPPVTDQGLLKLLNTQLDEFIKAYLAANPKLSSASK